MGGIIFYVEVEAVGMGESFKVRVENVRMDQRALKGEKEEEMDSPEEWEGRECLTQTWKTR